MKRLRFHLASLLAAVLTAAIFLGANMTLQFGDQGRLYPQWIRLENDFAYVEVHTRGEEWVWISQGWPFCIREQDAVTRQIPPGATPAPWAFSSTTPCYFENWNNALKNAILGVLAVVGALAIVEWRLRRRKVSHESNAAISSRVTVHGDADRRDSAGLQPDAPHHRP